MYVFLHPDGCPKTLMALIQIIGGVYIIGIPLGLWLHSEKFLSISWNQNSLWVKYYLKLSDRDLAWDWADISSVTVQINQVELTSISDGIQSIELALDSRKRLNILVVLLRANAPPIKINSAMFSTPNIVRILTAIKRMVRINGSPFMEAKPANLSDAGVQHPLLISSTISL